MTLFEVVKAADEDRRAADHALAEMKARRWSAPDVVRVLAAQGFDIAAWTLQRNLAAGTITPLVDQAVQRAFRWPVDWRTHLPELTATSVPTTVAESHVLRRIDQLQGLVEELLAGQTEMRAWLVDRLGGPDGPPTN